MIEREAQQPRERALVASVIYNRLRDGIPLGIDATVRYVTNNWSRPLTQSQLQVQSPYNTRTNKGLPAGADRQPGDRVHPRRREAGPHRLPVLRGQARDVRRARLLEDQRGVRGRRGPLQPRAPAPGRQVTHEVLTERRLLAVAGFPVGHSRSPAMQQAALDELGIPWRYLRLPLPPERFAETVRALPAAGLRGAQRDGPAQGGRAGAGRLRDPGGRGDRRRQHAQLHRPGNRGREHRRTGADRRAGRAPAGKTRPRAGRGRAPAAPPPGRCARRGPRCRSGTAPQSGRSTWPASWAWPTPTAPHPADIVVNATSVGLDPATDPLEALRLAGHRAARRSWWTWSTRTAGPRWPRGPQAGGSRVVDGLEVLVRQGALSLERWTGREAPLATMRAAVQDSLDTD